MEIYHHLGSIDPVLTTTSPFKIADVVAGTAPPRLRTASRLFEYVSQTRVHYWMSEQARPPGRRDRVVGRQLRWTGDNFEALASLT